jgi:organic radical activating enzyme
MFGTIRGDYRLCCYAEYVEPNIVLGKSDQSLTDVWNGEPLKKVRRDMLKGKIPYECIKACYDKEKLGDKSNRISSNIRFHHWSKLQKLTEEDGSIPTKPIYLDIRFGNLCNFRCRMCLPESSTSWYKEAREIDFLPDWDETKPIDMYTDNQIFWDSLAEVAPHLIEVYFAGGEPFVQDGHYKLLEYLIDNGHAEKITLSYNTNLSYDKYKKFDLQELWGSFKRVKLWPSCEGMGKRGEYSRKGLDWNKFESNVDKFSKHIDTVSSVVSMWSITAMPDLIIWLKRKNINFYLTSLTGPTFASVTCLPKEAKSTINKMYKVFLEKYGHLLNEHEIDNIKNVLSYMNGRDDTHELQLFKAFNNELDKSRGESFVDVYPEFASWYKNI